MTRELEDAKNAEYTKSDEGPGEVLVVGDTQPDVVGQDGDDVDDGHDTAEVVEADGGSVYSEHVLGGEDYDTGGVQAEQFHLKPFTARRTPVSAC